MKYEYKHIKPADIEAHSMQTITKELAEMGIEIPEEVKAIYHRCIHTSADFDYAKNLRITEGAVPKIQKALLDHPVFITDTNMACTGISKATLKKLDGEAICYMADPEIAEIAKANGTTRATASMIKGLKDHPDAIFAIGNAPTALIQLSEAIRNGARPSAVIGVPVGFVNVVESKEEILEVCEEYGIPAIVALGRKGGSNVAASICNALLYEATNLIDPHKRWH